MKSIAMFAAILALGPVAFAQTAAPKEAPKPPVISDSQKLAFFKANAEFQSASAQVQQATQVAQQKQAAMATAIKAITLACGKDFQPTMDVKNDPSCIAKTEPVKPAAPAEKK